MDDFKQGDVVVLKSGSPPMTLVKANGPLWVCVWWDASLKAFKREEFPAEAIALNATGVFS